MADHGRSLKPADTAALRRLVAGAVAGNGAPTTSDQQMCAAGINADVDIVADCQAGTYDFKVWYWYDHAETWVQDLSIGTAGTVSVTTAGARAVLNTSAASGIYVEVGNFAAAAAASVWAIGRGPRRP